MITKEANQSSKTSLDDPSLKDAKRAKFARNKAFTQNVAVDFSVSNKLKTGGAN